MHYGSDGDDDAPGKGVNWFCRLSATGLSEPIPRIVYSVKGLNPGVISKVG